MAGQCGVMSGLVRLGKAESGSVGFEMAWSGMAGTLLSWWRSRFSGYGMA